MSSISHESSGADSCVFCRIIRGQMPSNKVYEDDAMFAFHDINPVAPVHFMIVPKEHIASMADVRAHHADVLGRIMLKFPTWRVARG